MYQNVRLTYQNARRGGRDRRYTGKEGILANKRDLLIVKVRIGET
ncbi:MAG: hypothetical protein K0R57_6173 [Paenibacillaceae bacterium]|jgi:hypothetical protein|nr:hypothetical protein [Paenibacillaceae bacterium]